MEGKKQQMLATLVGCNYAGTPHELRGCINDVLAMRETLAARFGFAPSDITVLTDGGDAGAPSSAAVLPTGANIKRALAGMVSRAAPGDVLFFHYSGHGTLVPRRHGHGGRDDEAIVPSDFNLITGSYVSFSRSTSCSCHVALVLTTRAVRVADVDFRQLVDRVPRGATFTMVSDSCHSGGLIDQEKEQIGPSVTDSRAARPPPPAAASAVARGRFLPYAAVVGHLSGASGVDASHHVADHLLALFGADASAKFRHRHHDSGAPSPDDDDGGILLSGCQADETSADVPGDDEAGTKACGAFSSAVQAVLAAHPAPVSNREVVTRARELLRDKGFEQHPCLYCSDANADAPFLRQQQQKEPALL
jgi:hypothetical protein